MDIGTIRVFQNSHLGGTDQKSKTSLGTSKKLMLIESC